MVIRDGIGHRTRGTNDTSLALLTRVVSGPRTSTDAPASRSLVTPTSRTPDLPDDADVLARVAQGDGRALAAVYERHAGAVLGLARRILHNEALAEEVAQRVFLDLWQRPERFDPARGSVRSWLLAQTHGRSVDLVRSERARAEREARDARTEPRTMPTVEGFVDLSLLAADVQRAVASLPEGERSALMLAYFGGRTYREVALELGEPEGTIKSRIRAALSRLRDEIDPEIVP
jgi:RNA polymerase sigma-70 factor (ECF subfamily)